MEIRAILIAFIVGFGVFGIAMLVFGKINREKKSKELAVRAGGDELDPNEYMREQSEASIELQSPSAEMMSGILMLILPLLGKSLKNEQQQLSKKMIRAGIRSADAPVNYLFFQYVVSVFLVVLSLSFLMQEAEGFKQLQNTMAGVLLLVLGLFGPSLWLKNKTQKRQKVLVRSFPDALDLLLVCVESGLALDAALARVCNELGSAYPEVTEELNRTRLELSLLGDRSKAIYGLGERTDLVAFRSLAAALIQTEKFGTSLADTLRVMANDYRATRLLQAENKANRLPALITIPLILFLLPSMIIILVAPAILRVIAQGGLFGGG